MTQLLQLIQTRDKTATYKLALLRAIFDIARLHPELGTKGPDGRFQVPYQPLVDLWIEYYYPLLKNGVAQLPYGRAPRFAETMLRVGRKCVANTGEEMLRKPGKLGELRKMIRDTLHKGPVFYTRDADNNRVFEEYKLEGGQYWHGILVPEALWADALQNQTQIQEALTQEWEALSAEFAANKRPESDPNPSTEED